MARTIAGTVQDRNGKTMNGVPVTAWAAPRFAANHPVETEAPPVGVADAGPVNSGPAYGGEGSFVIACPNSVDYWAHAVVNGVDVWQMFPL